MSSAPQQGPAVADQNRRVIIDAQVHMWPEETPDRPWAPGRNQLFPSFTVERYMELREGSGVDRALIIPPAVDATRIDYAQKTVSRYPDVFRIVAFIEPHLPEQESFFPIWKKEKDVLGIRTSILDGRQHLLLDGSTDWLWAAAERYELPLMFAQTGQIPLLAPIVERHPDLTLILDHMGMSQAALKQGLFKSTVDEAVALAKYPNVSVKLSNSAALSKESYPWRDLDEHIWRLVDAYGPQRCYWGTDVTASLQKSTATYRQRVTHFTEELPFLSESDKDWIMGRALMERLRWS